jgi:hypothetical protein
MRLGVTVELEDETTHSNRRSPHPESPPAGISAAASAFSNPATRDSDPASTLGSGRSVSSLVEGAELGSSWRSGSGVDPRRAAGWSSSNARRQQAQRARQKPASLAAWRPTRTPGKSRGSAQQSWSAYPALSVPWGSSPGARTSCPRSVSTTRCGPPQILASMAWCMQNGSGSSAGSSGSSGTAILP